jgi:hypothetical protein
VPETLTCLHTAAALVPAFDVLCGEIAPDVPVRHLIAGDLLAAARTHGAEADVTREAVQAAVANAVDGGARVVLCTCSTIGDPAERADVDAVVMRVDRPMAERAVKAGSRILVVATLQSTVGPTTDLIRDVAAKLERDISLSTLVAEKAWARFEAGDTSGYYAEIVDAIAKSPEVVDAVVLAQGSMAPAADLCEAVDTPVLSSPRLGVEAAVAAYRATL